MKRLFILFVTVLMAPNLFAQQTDAKMNTFITTLMNKMTVDEKIGQLNLPAAGDFVTGQAKSSDIAGKIRKGLVGGLFNIKSVSKIKDVQKIAVEETRLKIPLLFGMDVIHGYETAFPIPLGLSCTWDMSLIEQSARFAATEASADGINWTFSPMVDVSKDPRWGRISEGNGEDAFLGGEIAKAMVKGYQGKDLSAPNTILSCVKHYALYGAAEAGRDYNTTDMSRIRMFNEYLPPYKAAVEAGVGSVMASFNEVDGVPATASKFLMTDVLRKMWGFKGFVVSDYTGVSEMIAHGLGDLQQVSALALKAGVEMDMVSEGFLTTLKKSLAEKKITMADINNACRLVLEAKYKLGLFEDPYRYINEERAKKEVGSRDVVAAVRNTASQSFVLLKNENNVLPLSKTAKIAVVGPLGNNKPNMPGTWSVAVDFNKAVTLVDGLKNVMGDGARVTYVQGSNFMYDSVYQLRATMFGREVPFDKRDPQIARSEAVASVADADVIVAALGEASEMSGEASSRSDISIPDAQKDLLKALLATGKPVVLVLFTGRPLVLTEEAATVPAILNVWFAGSQAGNAIADVLFGDVNPSGKLTTTFPRNVGQIPIYYSHKNTGRPQGKWFEKFRSGYLDTPNEPLYPFGYGLSYTTFNYSDVTISASSMPKAGKITATVNVTNTGKVTGKEVVQLYIQDLVGTVTRPVKELKGFKKVSINAGETKTVTFDITEPMLRFYDNEMKHKSEPGDFKVYIGTNSSEVKEATFTLK